jgi:hypothetical protein
MTVRELIKVLVEFDSDVMVEIPNINEPLKHHTEIVAVMKSYEVPCLIPSGMENLDWVKPHIIGEAKGENDGN